MKRYRFFDIGADHYYYDDFQTEDIIARLVQNSYLPANETIAEMIKYSGGKFKCAFSISGVALELLEQYAPELIDSFKSLAETGCVEFLAEPYAHSLASVYDPAEFEVQVKKHSEKIQELFGKKPTALRNAELIYSDEIGELVANMGYKTMLVEGARHVLGYKSPNYVYRHSYKPDLKLLIRNYKLSDDIAFRFSNRSWSDFPLTADKYISWLAAMPAEEQLVNIWLGYEALGEYQKKESGIFDFLKALPYHAMERNLTFVTPSEAVAKNKPVDIAKAIFPISWSSEEKDLSAWTGNNLQQEALDKLYNIGERVRMSSDRTLLRDWLNLQTTDHFRYMSHKDAWGTNYENAYDAFTNYMNILADFLQRVENQFPDNVDNEELNELLTTIRNQAAEIEALKKEVKTLKKKGK
ncbi:alpha-amylase [Bacteroidia bacterium]|nr:alpha-amylase [Bacteroidia bacterium]